MLSRLGWISDGKGGDLAICRLEPIAGSPNDSSPSPAGRLLFLAAALGAAFLAASLVHGGGGNLLGAAIAFWRAAALIGRPV